MPSVTVSSKYQVVIPRAVREALRIEPGQRVEVLAHDGRIEVIPVYPMPDMRGFLAGIDTDVPREEDRAP
jgi:AbrB family looped-hinge helix DNA binding protein